jgi:hypothetical protein
MHAWQRRRIDLTKLLKNACGILFQMRINAKPFPLTSLADLADGVTVVPFHPKHAQRTPLVVVAGNLTGIRYWDEIVQPYVIPLIQAQATNVTFQQDNARPHVARVVQYIVE